MKLVALHKFDVLISKLCPEHGYNAWLEIMILHQNQVINVKCQLKFRVYTGFYGPQQNCHCATFPLISVISVSWVITFVQKSPVLELRSLILRRMYYSSHCSLCLELYLSSLLPAAIYSDRANCHNKIIGAVLSEIIVKCYMRYVWKQETLPFYK